MADPELVELIEHGREERNLEYKGQVNWETPEVRARIIKCILALANVRDGGAIVVGVDELGEEFHPVGLSPEDRDSFTQDGIAAQVDEFADPYVEIALSHENHEGRDYVVIQVKEFSETPVICKRDGTGLRRGAIYTRPRRMNECAEVASHAEMREMMDIGIEKGLRAFRERAIAAGYRSDLLIPTDEDLFRDERDGL